MVLCELCNVNEAIGLYQILDSHILENKVITRYLCSYCVHDLKKNVHLKLIKGIPIPKEIDFSKISRSYPAIAIKEEK